jgi:NAD(P)-dependent dehydrogenase (short-subunit alcohol dehydrogenase family)
MKTVVITGSARGFGYEMIKLFKNNNFNTVLCDINEESLKQAKEVLEKEIGAGKVLAVKADITNEADVKTLID